MGKRGKGVETWYFSPDAGEICIDVTGLSDDEIRLVHKAIEEEFMLRDGVETMFDKLDDGQVREWWIYQGIER